MIKTLIIILMMTMLSFADTDGQRISKIEQEIKVLEDYIEILAHKVKELDYEIDVLAKDSHQ